MSEEKKWFVVCMRVTAANESDAVQQLRRSVSVETVSQVVNDLETTVLEKIVQAGTPWKAAYTAPKTGAYFVGLDANIELAQTFRWDLKLGKFVTYDGEEEPFTHWCEMLPEP